MAATVEAAAAAAKTAAPAAAVATVAATAAAAAAAAAAIKARGLVSGKGAGGRVKLWHEQAARGHRDAVKSSAG